MSLSDTRPPSSSSAAGDALPHTLSELLEVECVLLEQA